MSLTDAGEVVLYYLGQPVVPERATGLAAESVRNGWVPCRWPDGKVWYHWFTQLTLTPWGC